MAIATLTIANFSLGGTISLCTRAFFFFFIGNMVYQGGGYPLMNLKLKGPKYYCLVPWYRVGSPHSIGTKIIKIGQRMTSQ